MDIKHFITAACAMLASQAFALDILPYTPSAFERAQASGKPVALHFFADWCGTCKAQERGFLGLKGDPELSDVLLLVVNYDQEKELRKSLGVRSQSTVLVYKGARQTGQLSGDTKPAKLQLALKSAL
jgi:thioredoxin 1